MKPQDRIPSPRHAPTPAESRLDQVTALGRTSCVMTWTEFEALRKVRQVDQELREIFQELGVLGYVGPVTIFEAGNWSEAPLTFRDVQDL